MRSIIAVDIDEVLARHNHTLVKFHNEKYGTRHTEADYFSDHWSLVWNVDMKEAERRVIEFHEADSHSKFQPIKGASEVLALLRRDYELVLVTFRRRSIVESTHTWIEKYFPGLFSDIRFIHAWEDPLAPSKAEVCKELNAKWLIDDSVKHCKVMAESGGHALLFGKYAWNRTDNFPERMQVVENWPEVLEYFSMGQLNAEFKERVYDLVAQIPKGKVMTYGDVASYCGSAFASRQVGQIAHFGPAELPWQRVVNRHGGLATAYSFGGIEGHKAALEADGVEIDEEYRVVGFELRRWHLGRQQPSLL